MTKQFRTQHNIGRAKYTISYQDGVSTHKDSSPYWGICIFSNKRKFEAKQKELIKDGYTES